MRAAALILLAVAASAQPPRRAFAPAHLAPLRVNRAEAFARTPALLCRAVRLEPNACRTRYEAPYRATLPSAGVWMDTTLTVGRWQGGPVRLQFVGSIRAPSDSVRVVARRGVRVVDTMEFEASSLFGLWTFCPGTAPLDLDADGLREVGIGLTNGGGPFGVNVGVAFVRFVGETGRLGFWPADPAGVDPLIGPPSVTTPRLIRGGAVLESQHRMSGFGREWYLDRYRVPSDTLERIQSIHYRAVEGTEGEWDTYRYERTDVTPGRPIQTRRVHASEVPSGESERFGCP